MKLAYILYHEGIKLPKLDFTEDDGSDPVEINRFFHNDLDRYHSNKLSTVRLVQLAGKIVAYFTVSMNAIELSVLDKNEKVSGTTTKKYPAMLLGRIGVDKKYRKKGIAKAICTFCQGLASVTSEKVACRYIMLHTPLNKVSIYQKMGFIQSVNPPKKGIVSMYMRIV
ncbi:MAG: GNAT family N-acetyltransferase [Nitrosopumilaceae archaeon]|nr:GNAT family N-acetyltransferase [Nitrosopumilaceae archaeon]